MATLKQIEALYWIARLGSFERAANRLNTTQSAVSKRIQELEALSAEPLFNRTARSARLTPHGKLLLDVSEKMLRLRDDVDALMRPSDFARGRFRFGVTEMTALTWLPAFVSALRTAYPEIDLEPEVESSETLFAHLQKDLVDVIIVPDVFHDPQFASLAIGEVNMSWMCGPGFPLWDRPMPLTELENLTVLVQDTRSGSGQLYARWLDAQGVKLNFKVSSNSLIALTGMTAAGLGISYLPREASGPLLRAGRLRILDTEPSLPPVPYVAMMRVGSVQKYEAFVIDQMVSCCDFTSPVYQEKPAIG